MTLPPTPAAPVPASPGPAPSPEPVPVPAVAAGKPATSSIRKLHLPYLAAIAAMLSMAVYGLTVPGSPLQSVTGTAFGLWAGCLAVGGGVLMSILAPLLGNGNAATSVPKQR